MGQPQLRPGMFAGSARIGGTVGLINVTGIITGVTKTGTGQYTLTLEPGANPNEHNYSVTPILTGFNADASGSVDVTNPAAPVVQTTVGGVAADCDCYVEVKRVLTADGTVFPSPAAVPAGPPAPPSAGMVLVGSDTSESSTNATADTDMVTLSGFSIAVGQPFILEFDFRKTAGGAANPKFGLKLNSTVVAASANSQFVTMTAINQAESGHAVLKIGARDTNYLEGYTGYYQTGKIGGTSDQQFMFFNNAVLPTTSITSITIRGNAVLGAITISVKNIFIWTPPIS